jgi:UDP-glucose 4-epimerase
VKEPKSNLNLVLGGLGFIGTNLVKHLESTDQKVIIADILSKYDEPTRINENTILLSSNAFEWVDSLKRHIQVQSSMTIWHLGANSDISKAAQDFELDYVSTLGSTLNAIEIATAFGSQVTEIIFTSSSAVYGNMTKEKRFSESDLLSPISNYGAMKAASEYMLKIFSEQHGIPLKIFRLANIVGPYMTHGLIFDLVEKLKQNDKSLQVLGNGYQQKTYMHVHDLIEVMLFTSKKSENITWNVGPEDDGILVKDIVVKILDLLNIKPSVTYQSKKEGWPGDVVKSLMNVNEMNSQVNFKVMGSQQAIAAAIQSIVSEAS